MNTRLSKSPVRTCVSCRERGPQSVLARLQFIDRKLVSVAGAGFGGRSAYVHQRESCIADLLTTKGLSRSLRRNVDRTERGETVASLLLAHRERMSDSPERLER